MTLPPPSSEYYAEAEVAALAGRGVRIPVPGQVAIHRSVLLERIARGAVLHPFTRLSGAQTRIDSGAEIGKSGPATLENAWVGERAVIGELGPVTLREAAAGPGTVLGCGVAEHAVFLGKEAADPAFTTGYGFRVRRGSLYEEDASSAQFTDTKMTVLLPWVTLGSGLNWCDILVAGGTGAGLGEFSEIGSGCIHFNFTPRGDKATASRIGNVVDGVFLDQPRVFIGGNGSLVGPLTAPCGALTGAGGRFAGELQAGLNPPQADRPGRLLHGTFDVEVYGSIQRVVRSQCAYVGELAALDAWYLQVRQRLAAGHGDRAELYRRAQAVVQANIRERITQLEALAARMPRSAELLGRTRPADPRIGQQRAFHEQWPALRRHLEQWSDALTPLPAALAQAVAQGAERESCYTRIVRGLSPVAKSAGRAWLGAIRDQVAAPPALAAIPPIPAGG
jgi:UDP-N-acetylglucosamine/UDP-N-acetylgalactosamine diphosphorylase